jgi:NAD(P)H dehydrogenase (quinone)
MTTPAPFVLVLYYSRHGSVLNLAKQIAKGIESQGIEAKIRTVADDCQEDAEYPLVTQQELTSCSGLALGSPCRFGTMAAPLKSFWESTSTNWLSGDLIDKPACVFTSSSSLHGGNEATLLSMSLPLLHHGMMLMGVPYSEPELHNTTSGGTPYGASHVSGLRSDNTLTKSEIAICKTLGQRLAITAKKLSQ